MKLKDKALIEYFGKKNISEEDVAGKGNIIVLNYYNHTNIDLTEVFELLKEFPEIKKVDVKPCNAKQIENVCNWIPYGIDISLSSLTKSVVDNIAPNTTERITQIAFNSKHRETEVIPVGTIMQKFPNASSIYYECSLEGNVNVIDFDQINYMVARNPVTHISFDLAQKYKNYAKSYPYRVPRNFSIGSQTIYDKTAISKWNEKDDENYYLPACDIKNSIDLYRLSKNASGKKVVLLANSMADVNLKQAYALKQQGIDCKIRMHSYDNAKYQNEDYDLNEYIAMSKIMQDLIGDINDRLPETEKFRLIYERITTFLEYDYAAAYPANKEEKIYSRKQNKNCRNLRNGLLYGKTVCAGYADILKNACLMKGIECEYIQGPVDDIEDRDSFLMKKKEDRDEVVYSSDKDVITRSYHAWNKVKINGVWYNVDPTWDKDDIERGVAPRYALLSDATYKKLGRPTSEVLRHPCRTDLVGRHKDRIFYDLYPSDNLVANQKIMDFESTVNEYGRPRQLPAVPKDFPWTKMFIKLKRYAKAQQAKISAGMKDLIYYFRTKIDPDFDKTEELHYFDDEDTLPLPRPDFDRTTEQIPVYTAKDKKPSWEVSNSVKENMRNVEKKIQEKSQNYKTEEKINSKDTQENIDDDKNKDDEIGE